MKTALISFFHLFFISTHLFALDSSTSFEAAPERKVVWFLGGHMQDLFKEDYLKPMLNSGYDLAPMHALKRKANQNGIDFFMGDPNATSLTSFSHIRSGIAEVEGKYPQLSVEELERISLPENIAFIIVFEVMPHQINYLKEYPKEKLVLFLWEPPSVMPQNYDGKVHEFFGRVYTWNDELVDNRKYFKFHYPVLHSPIENIIPFESKKLCTMIAGNKASSHPNELYTARRNVIHFFESHHAEDFDLYGKWWPASYKTYQGGVDNKIDCLKKYKFSFTYENVKNIPGYITEKIFDSFQAGCVPVYLGANNIHLYVPKKCYIDRSEYKDEAALYDFMKQMSKERYEQYLEDIQDYLKSPQAQHFSSEHFVETVMQLLIK